jgi:hypothetical protein
MSEFKVHSPLDIDVYNFFKEYDISKWEFSRYFDFIKLAEPNVSSCWAKINFCSDLNKISTLPYFLRRDQRTTGIAASIHRR